MGGVDFYVCIAKGVSEVNGVCIEGGFAGVVGGPFEVVGRRARLGVVGEGTEDAAQVDDSGGRSFFEKWDQGLSEFNKAEEVSVKSISVSLDGNVFDGVFGGVEINSGVVDEDV